MVGALMRMMPGVMLARRAATFEKVPNGLIPSAVSMVLMAAASELWWSATKRSSTRVPIACDSAAEESKPRVQPVSDVPVVPV